MDKNNLITSNIYNNEINIQNLIYLVRNQQVMMDSDLAMLYHVETSALNRAVKRNIIRFPKKFCFQLTKEEYDFLICQIGISKNNDGKDGRGGRRKLPYVFTEQGIAMLSSVLRSDIAILVSIHIMESFVEMRKYMADSTSINNRMNTMELRQVNDKKETVERIDNVNKRLDIIDERIDKVFNYISSHEESEQKVFFDGQIYDAFSKIAELINKADAELILIDNYVNIETLNLLAKKKPNVSVTIYTLNNNMLSNTDVKNFNAQYPQLDIKYTKKFHDRFLIVDNSYGYHIGASIKDVGKKCFGINLIQEMDIIKDILQRL